MAPYPDPLNAWSLHPFTSTYTMVVPHAHLDGVRDGSREIRALQIGPLKVAIMGCICRMWGWCEITKVGLRV